MDLSWNGFTTGDCAIFGVTLKDNTTLKELDVSNNQLGESAIGYLMKGIQTSDGLEILRVSLPPIKTESGIQLSWLPIQTV